MKRIPRPFWTPITLVIVLIGGPMAFAIAGTVIASITQVKPIPEWIKEICLVLAGGLIGFLTNTHSREEAQAVTIQQPASEPVPVQQTEDRDHVDGS
jgi:hypothetical protein